MSCFPPPTRAPGFRDAGPREWVRVVRVITGRIVSGELRAEAQLLARSALAIELGVFENTVAHAFGELEGRCIPWRVPGKPYRVGTRVILDSAEAAGIITRDRSRE